MPRTSNPLANLFQAMGQCSTTPAEHSHSHHGQYAPAGHANHHNTGDASTNSHGSRSDRSRHTSKASSRSYHTAHTSSQHAAYQPQQAQQQQQGRDGRDDSSDAHMSDVAGDNARRRGSGTSHTSHVSGSAAGHNTHVAAMVANARHANTQFERLQSRARSRSRSTSRRRASPSPNARRQCPSSTSASAPSTPSGSRESTTLMAPPAGTEKKRCYRLNLEVSTGNPSVDPSTGQHIFGPLIYEPPAHHLPGGYRRSSSWAANLATAGMRGLHVTTHDTDLMMDDNDDDDDNEQPTSEVEIAVKTASIFRGIRVDAQTGEILEQNARASRSARKNGGGNGGGKKAGEKSRQVAKIDKAQDLVDEDGDGGIDPDSKTQCLYIMGEYDDMKYLVRDGAKKLRDATNLTDEALLSINRQRTASSAAGASFGSPGTPGTPSRKRISPYPTPSSGHNIRSSSRPRSAASTPASHQGATPRLKANPRDSRARYGGQGAAADGGGGADCDAENAHVMQCGADPTVVGGGWSTEMLNMSHKLGNIWNCGATVNSDGTMSPTHPASPMAPGKATHLNAFAVNPCGAGAAAVMAREGRNESAYDHRSSGRTERVP